MHVEKGGYPTRLQRSFHNPPIQTERKSSSLTNTEVSLFYQLLGRYWQKILLNRLNAHLDQAGLIPESQCGFRKERGTIDMIFTVRQLQEKCKEQNVDLYMTFVDLTKAFDTDQS